MGLVTGLIILVYPASGPVAWLPGLGAGLAWYFLTPEDRVLRRIGFATGILLVASIPAVILVDVYLALGLLGPIYTLSALLSMNEAIRAFYQERGTPRIEPLRRGSHTIQPQEIRNSHSPIPTRPTDNGRAKESSRTISDSIVESFR